MGQYIQEGERDLFETVVRFAIPSSSCLLNPKPGDRSGLEYLRGKDLRFVNEQARRGTALAHADGATCDHHHDEGHDCGGQHTCGSHSCH